MAKIAFLVLAAFAPKTLAILAGEFGNAFDIHVHVDRKVDLGTYRDAAGDPRVNFIERRVDVFWAGFSMITATINLIAAASCSDYDALCLISDDTLPLFGPDMLGRLIGEARNPWIETVELPSQHPIWGHYSEFYSLDSRFSNPRWYPMEERALGDGDHRGMQELLALRDRGKAPLAKLHRGKQWWILPQHVADGIVGFHEAQEHVRESFRFAAIPDELYFQTIFRILHPDQPTAGNPMFDEFNRNPKPYVYRTAQEVMNLASPGRIPAHHLFMRKIDARGDVSAATLHAAFWAKAAEKVIAVDW